MGKLIWLFPLLFIFHDLEEIIGFGVWGKKNITVLEKRMPKVAPLYRKMYYPYSTDGMALAVFEILLLCIVVTLVSLLLNTYQLFIGVFIGYIIHLFIHLLQAILWRGYIPAVATSIICIPISIFVLNKCLNILNYSTPGIVLWSVIGLAIILANVQFAHFLMHWFTKKFVED